ncbi:hypothetical protein SUNI508_09955 [Seiridium unicorne]|uniref:Uncharacterized protein n=1 Tax=Seiridium unicorne TaxID=138068 RepID=A0ABR2UNK6_9PEZI
MRLAVISVLVLEALPAFSFPSRTTRSSVLQRHEAIPILDLKVTRRNKASKAAKEAAAGEALAATNQTTLAATEVLAVSEEFEEGVVRTIGVFGSANPVQGGNLFTKMKLPANTAGAIEAEYNGTAANTITVAPKMATIAPPAGLMYVDPLTFTIATATPPETGDIHQVDYIFGEASINAVDVSQSVIGKLDIATNQFVTEKLGELEFEAEENEIALKLADMNGEWAVFVPTTAVKPGEEEGAEGEAEGEAAQGEEAN